MLIIGVDPSLTSTGLAALTTWATGPLSDGPHWDVRTVHSSAPKVPTEYAQLKRMQLLVSQVDGILDQVCQQAGPRTIDLAVIEAPAFSKNNGMAHERAGLWWLLFHALTQRACPVLVIKPNLRAKYATGRGNAGKDEVMLAASRRYPTAAITNNNESDAVVLAAMGARMRGEPVDQVPAGHQAAMKTLAYAVL